MKTLLLALCLLAAVAPAQAGGVKPRVTGWNPSPTSGWRFDKGGIPAYPEAAVRQRIEGDVLLNVRISNAGRIDNIESASGEPQLITAVKATVATWSFRPAQPSTRPQTAHVPVGISFRLDLDLPELLERAQGLTIERRGPGDTLIGRIEAATPQQRTNVARALTQGKFLSGPSKSGNVPRDVNWRMKWRTQGRVVDVLFSETRHTVLVADETRRWSGSNDKQARTLSDELHTLIPAP
jgi:TonB family protein